MSNKDNFSQAAYEMFGIGRGGSKREADKTAEKPAESAAMDVEEDEMSLTVAPTIAEVKPLEKVPEKPRATSSSLPTSRAMCRAARWSL